MSHRLPALCLAALLLTTACHRNDKAEQLAALDSAYQSGLLTKDEYEAKKRALTAAAPPAPPPAAAPVPAPTAPATAVPAAAPPAKEMPAPPPAPQPASTRPAAREPEPELVAGCEDAGSKPGGQKGTEERFLAASPEAVRRAAVSALGTLDFNIHKNTSSRIEASKKRHIGVIVGAGGERVILTFQKSERGGQAGTRVTGETRKSFVGHMAQRTWTDAVLAQMACKLRAPSR